MPKASSAKSEHYDLIKENFLPFPPFKVRDMQKFSLPRFLARARAVYLKYTQGW